MAVRVVITSSKVISSAGHSSAEIIDSFKANRVVFERPGCDPETAVSPVNTFDFKEYVGRYKDSRYLTRGAMFAVASAFKVLEQSGLDKTALERCGLFAGSGPNLDVTGEFTEIINNEISEKGLSALWILKFLPNTVTSAISRLTGIRGENITTGSACAASLMAIGEAYRKIKDGYLDAAFAGGGDSRLSTGGILAYKKAQALWTGTGDPAMDYTPFGQNRTGFIPGEGGAFFLLESLEHAQQRGASILAEISGYGASMDGYTMTAPHPDGKWAMQAVMNALNEAATEPDQVDLISTHGTGTVLNDQIESDHIARLFNGGQAKVTSFKSWVGHLASACGAVELGICLACLEHGYWPEIRNLKTPCHDSVNFLMAPETFTPSTILLENFGFGGQNSALVVKQWNG